MNNVDWGNAEMVAKNFQFEFKRRGDGFRLAGWGAKKTTML